MGCSDSYEQDMSSRMEIGCFCGNVVLKTREATPRMHYECACRDCVQKGEWMMSQGSPGKMTTD